MSPLLLSLSKRALNAPGGVRPTSRRRGSNNSFAAFLRVVLRFEREKYSSSSRRRKRGQNQNSAGKNQLQNPLLGAVNVVFKTRAKGAASRATGRNGASWKSSWTRAPSRAFARYVCVVCARFTRRLVSLSLSLCVCDTNM